MQPTDTIVITGAAGFIASYLAGALNSSGFTNLVLVDDFSRPQKQINYSSKHYHTLVDRSKLECWLAENGGKVQYCFHLGARTDTTEMDYAVHKRLNLDYSKMVWQACTRHHIPLVYASSAATYGNGEYGYSDMLTPADEKNLAPLNPYGLSKLQFDIWAHQQAETPPFWAGLKFLTSMAPMSTTRGAWRL